MLTINVDDLQGRTPLHYAAFINDLETIKLLLHHGAKATAADYQVYYLHKLNSHEHIIVAARIAGADGNALSCYSGF